MLPKQITHRTILRVLAAGFGLVIVLLLIAAFVGVRNIQRIQQNAGSLVREQSVTNRLIEEIQRQQVSLGEVFSILARDPDSVDSERILAQLGEMDRNLDRIVAAGESTPEAPLWRQLNRASDAFSNEARRLLTMEYPETFASRELFRHHEGVMAVTAKLIGASYEKVIAAQKQIDEVSERLLHESFLLLGLCLLLALVSSVFTVRTIGQLFRSMEWQTGELSRVSWHMLENQEVTARRFSHELHDELGQSLTAVKANLLALQQGGGPERMEDCVHLVDEAIGNVRQLSQLLRPTILDDFGLPAGLRWLCEGFTHRTGIEVEFDSSVEERLPDEVETHLFRIAQEALTNIARHSGARRVRIELALGGGEVLLSIRDDGKGLGEQRAGGMGMIGMRARARGAGGDVVVRPHGTADFPGVAIEVSIPVGGVEDERKDPHLVG